MRRRRWRRNRGCEANRDRRLQGVIGHKRAAADRVLELHRWGEVGVAAHSIADVPRLPGAEIIEFRKPDEEGS